MAKSGVSSAHGPRRTKASEDTQRSLVELISGAHSVPGFGAEVAVRLRAWTDFAQTAVESTIDPMLLALVASPKEVAYAIVAMYLGLEMLSHLDGDRTNALALFGRATNLISLLDTFGVLASATPAEPE